MAAPPPADSLIAALLAAVLGVFAPATGLVVTVLKPAPTTACSTAGVPPSVRDLVAPVTTAAAGPPDWQELAATLSGELADSADPEAQGLARAIGDTGTPVTGVTPATGTRATVAPRPSAAPRNPGRSAAPGPSAARSRPGTGPCPVPSGARTATARTPTARTPAAAPSGEQPWEQLAGQLAAALTGSTDPRAVDLQEALDRAGFPVPTDPGGGG